MNLQEMCEEAARNSDRYDEFLIEDGGAMYLDDALHYFNVFTDGVNEAYRAVCRQLFTPSKMLLVTPEDMIIDLSALEPPAAIVRSVLSADKTEVLRFNMIDRFHIEVPTVKPVTVDYHYLPPLLSALTDEPIFPDSIVEPELYVNMATARMWLSEKKPDLAQPWLQRYYECLRGVSSTGKRSSSKRIGRRIWR